MSGSANAAAAGGRHCGLLLPLFQAVDGLGDLGKLGGRLRLRLLGAVEAFDQLAHLRRRGALSVAEFPP